MHNTSRPTDVQREGYKNGNRTPFKRRPLDRGARGEMRRQEIDNSLKPDHDFPVESHPTRTGRIERTHFPLANEIINQLGSFQVELPSEPYGTRGKERG